MKKSLLTERFQQLAGLKPLYELDEAKSFSDIEKEIYEVPQAGYEGISGDLEKFKGKFIAPTGGGSQMGKIEVTQAQEYEKKPNGVFRPIGSTISLKFGGYDLNNLKVVGKVPGIREEINEDLKGLMAHAEKMAAFANKQSGYEGGVSSPVRGVLAAMTAAGAPDFDGDEDLKAYWFRKLTKAIKTQKGRKYMSGYSE